MIALDERMLKVMEDSELKALGLQMMIHMKDETTRKGIYKDIVVNPTGGLFKSQKFIKFVTNKPEKDLIVYLPIDDIATIEWSEGE